METLKQKHVRIIYVPVEVVVPDPAKRAAMGGKPADTATLADVAKHIGAPEPTDVIVFNKRPYHFAGKPGDKRLCDHPQCHRDFPETVTVLKPGEEAVWTSDRYFEVTNAVWSGGHGTLRFPETGTPIAEYPFSAKPLRAEEASGRWAVHSGEPSAGARQHMYKISFRIEADDIDPDVYCSN